MTRTFLLAALIILVGCAEDAAIPTLDVGLPADILAPPDAGADPSPDAADATPVPDSDDAVTPPDSQLVPAPCRVCVSAADCDADQACVMHPALDFSVCVSPCEPTGGGCTGGQTCSELDGGFWGCLGSGDACGCGSQDDGREAACALDTACGGRAVCEGGELGPCEDATRAELCNGIDDDCDGTTDLVSSGSLCDDGVPCTVGTCEDGACHFEVAPNQCLIDAHCWTSGQAQLQEPCHICAPAADPKHWTSLKNGSPCEEGDPCSNADTCNAGECQAGGVTSCDDGDPCTADSCASGMGCVHTGLDDAECDDGDACTAGDQCQAGICQGVPKTCDDGLDCTVQACEGGDCVQVALVPGACLVDGACWQSGQSVPGAPCRVCQPFADPTVWTEQAVGVPCDDGDLCTTGKQCGVGGTCVGTPVDCDDQQPCTLDTCKGLIGCLNVEYPPGLPCDDGDPCTTPGQCLAGGVCEAGAALDCDDGDPCTADSCVGGEGCIYGPNAGASCNDNDPCTVSDACGDDGCVGQPLACDDGLDCTADSCFNGGCQAPPLADWCVIDEACVAAGTASADNPCLWCDPQTDNTSWVPQPAGMACDDGLLCTVGAQCQAGACVGAVPLDCDDHNPCTQNACDAVLGCTTTNLTGSCDDGQFCTVQDTCNAGDCHGSPRDCSGAAGPNLCLSTQCNEDLGACTAIPQPGACDDGDPCTVVDLCQNGQCIGTPKEACCATALECDDQNPCTDDTCNAAGACIHAPVASGTACDDGRFCTINDTCNAGHCTGAPRVCPGAVCQTATCGALSDACELTPEPAGTPCADDGNPCTADTCQAAECAHVANTEPCDDGDACTFNDRCAAAQCAGTAYDCDDSLSCTTDLCLGDGGCKNAIAKDACVASNQCWEAGEVNPKQPCEQCTPALSTVSFSPRPDGSACPEDSNPCTADQCQSGACAHPNVVGPCDDGEPCTQDDGCDNGTCHGSLFDCDDGLACTLDSCDGVGGCSHTLEADACKIGSQCVTAGLGPASNPCQVCNPSVSTAQWSPRPDGTVCDDNSLCTQADACTSGTCTGAVVSCDDTNPCTDDSCAPFSGCQHAPNTKPCNDGLYCTVADTCGEGTCAGGARACDGVSDLCNDGVCDEALAACVKQPVTNGTACDDGNVCTGLDTCQSGACGGPPLDNCCTTDADCADGNACTVAACVNTTCVYDPGPKVGSACDDGVFCSTQDTCDVQGQCAGTPRDCAAFDDACNTGTCNETAKTCEKTASNEGGPCASDANPCTDDLCQGGACAHPQNTAACDDGEPCTLNDTCQSGFCAGVGYGCDDSLVCTLDVCDGAGGCSHDPFPGWCAIGGVCVAKGAASPDNSCLICQPDASATTWTPLAPGSPCDDGSACTSPDICGEGGTCQPGPLVCNPCEGKPDGALCNDANPQTGSDFCLDQVCAGFVTVSAVPVGLQPDAGLTRVIFSAKRWWATGTDTSNTGQRRAFLTELTPTGGAVVAGSAALDAQYTALTDRLATTDKGTVLFYEENQWKANSALKEKIQALNGAQNIQAAWGRLSPVGKQLEYFLAGPQWTQICTGSINKPNCAPSKVKGDYFYDKNTLPRAIGGFGPLGNKARAYMCTDEPNGAGIGADTGGDVFGDVFRHKGAQADDSWQYSYYDLYGAARTQNDLSASASDDIWVVGTAGLIHARLPAMFGATWRYIQVFGNQTAQDYTGVQTSGGSVLVSANVHNQSVTTAALMVYNRQAPVDQASSWTALPLDDRPDVTQCTPAGCTVLEGSHVSDVWRDGQTVVVVGWTTDPVTLTRTVAVYWRAPLVGIIPIAPLGNQ